MSKWGLSTTFPVSMIIYFRNDPNLLGNPAIISVYNIIIKTYIVLLVFLLPETRRLNTFVILKFYKQ